MTAVGTKASPVHPVAAAAFAASVAALALAFYGSMVAEARIADSPLNVARGRAGPEAARAGGAHYGELAAFVLPFALGLSAAVAGGAAMRRIERAEGRYRGDAAAVFAVFIGGFAATVGGCMTVAVFAWRHVPSPYVQ